MALFSCQDDILDKQPLDVISDGILWSDQKLIDAYITEMYAQTPVFVNDCVSLDDPNTSEKVVGMFNVNQLSDEATYHWGFYSRFKVRDMKAGLMDAHSNYELLDYWDLPYKTIRSINIFLERIEDSPVDEDFKAVRIAEAKFLRAFNYFAMCKRYGGVPLITKAQSVEDPEEELYPRRNSEKELYDFIISEMDEITKVLPEVVEDFGRPSKYAALALKSRAALYAGSIAKYGSQQLLDNGKYILGFAAGEDVEYFKKSYDASMDIVNGGHHDLYDQDADKTMNFRNIFMNEGNAEVIFAKRFDGNNIGGTSWGYDFAQCPKPHAWNAGHKDSPFLEMAEEFERIDGTPGTIDRGDLTNNVWTYESLWGGRDPRFYATLFVHGTPWQGDNVDFHNGLIKEDGSLLFNGTYFGADGNGPQVTAQGPQASGGHATTSLGVLKYLDETANNLRQGPNSKTDYIVFRYAEILLNLAEAAIELGKDGEAADAINKIRDRAGLPKRPMVDLNDIIHERKVELAFEGHRYWDLRRWRLAEEKLTGGSTGMRYVYVYDPNAPGDVVFNTMPPGVKGFKVWWWPSVEKALAGITGNREPLFRPHYYYMPIAAKRRSQNPNLLENPGY